MTEKFFKPIKKTMLSDLDQKDIKDIPNLVSSDITIQTDNCLVQYEFIEPEEREKKKIKEGCYTLEDTNAGLLLDKMELKKYTLLESIDNTKVILDEANKFFNKLSIYKRLGKDPKRALLLASPPGVGKCLHPDQGVLMYNGSIKKAKNIMVGDKLMGPDSQPRNVMVVSDGYSDMFRVTHSNGDSYVVNDEHILSLKHTNTKQIVNISVRDYLEKSEYFKDRYKGYRTETIKFDQDKELSIDPYILGLWLGDGNSANFALTSMDNVLIKSWCDYGEKFGLKIRKEELDNKADIYHITTGLQHGAKHKNILQNELRNLNLKNNKHIPDIYKFNSVDNRLKLLAGLIDSDGHLIHNCYEIVQKKEELIDDIRFICRSLGLTANKKTKIVNDTKYFRLFISGDVDKIPVKLDRKKAQPRKQIKNHLVNGICIEPIGWGKYNGFILDQDHLFVLDNFIVTHNTAAINKVCETFLKEEGTSVVIWDTSQVRSAAVNRFFLNKAEFDEKVKKFILIMEDIGGGSMDDYEGPRGADSALLNLLDGVGNPFGSVPTFIIATTNNPETSVEALIDRPGRFDKVEILKTPNKEECEKLLHFIGKDYIDNLKPEEVSKVAELASKNKFSIAHLQEIIVRSMLDDISILESTEQLVTHKKRFQNAFNDPKQKLGLNR